jgi:hypothetical protein
MSRHLITTTAKPATCPGCRGPILRGIAEGRTVTVEPEPIEPTTETSALLTGAMTFTLASNDELIHRDADRIRRGHLRGTIHIKHLCRQQMLGGGNDI